MVQSSPSATLFNIYSSILRQCDVGIETGHTAQNSKQVEVGGSCKAKLKIPLIAEVEAGGSGKGSVGTTKTKQYKEVEYDLALAQDISEILHSINFKKYIVLDNFHYLDEDVQKQFAFDLRIFQETDVRFIVLGIWRERNRLTQFNGDLQDRVVEVAVEPWEKKDFLKVVEKGCTKLNVDFGQIISLFIDSSFDSIGVFQELCKESCLAAGVKETTSTKITINELHLKKAIEKKLIDYSSRHLRSFETFADSAIKSREGQTPLFIPYYFLKVLLTSDFDTIVKGLKRKDLHQEISNIHHRPNDIRASDMSNFLYQLTKYQINRKINPPLFDFDRSINTLKIIDSTLYFFLRNSDREQIFKDITPPSDDLKI